MKTRLLALLVSLTLLPSLVWADTGTQTDPGNQAVYLQLIQRMQKQGAWYASLAHIDAHRLQYGDSPALQLAQADALRQTEQLQAARAIYEKLLRSPFKAAALNGLGLIEAHHGDLDEAIGKLQQASTLSPLNVDYLGDLGFAHLLAGNHDAARLPLAQAVELAPADGRSIANAAIWHLLAGNEPEAAAMLERAGLTESSRQQVQATAQRLRLARAPAPAPAVSPAEKKQAVAEQSIVTRPAEPFPSAPSTTPEGGTEEAGKRFLPRAPMLEHFATSSTQQGSQP